MAGGEEQMWAQRCKLYIWRSSASSWVTLGTGKCALLRVGNEASFVFEDEKIRVPTVRHSLSTATPLAPFSGKDRSFAWTASDQILPKEDGQEEAQWFSVKFGQPQAAANFKEIFDLWVPPDETAPPSPTELEALASMKLIEEALLSPTMSPTAGQDVVHDLGIFEASPAAVGEEVWMLLFEKGVTTQDNVVREHSMIYVGTYDVRAQAILNAVRAMDMYCDPKMPWRQTDLWKRREDYRQSVEDGGVVVAVQNHSGAFLQTRIKRLPRNEDLPSSGGDVDLWWL